MASKTIHTLAEQPAMLSITFAGARLVEFKRVDASSASFKFHCALGGSITQLFARMGWDVPGDTSSLEKLDGKLKGGTLMLTPKLDKDERLKLKSKDSKIDTEFELSVDFDAVTDFQCHRLELEQRKGKGHRRELRFSGSTKAEDACAIFESYMQHTDNARGSLKVTYLKEPKQGMIGGDDTQGKLISEEQANDTVED